MMTPKRKVMKRMIIIINMRTKERKKVRKINKNKKRRKVKSSRLRSLELRVRKQLLLHSKTKKIFKVKRSKERSVKHTEEAAEAVVEEVATAETITRSHLEVANVNGKIDLLANITNTTNTLLRALLQRKEKIQTSM